MLDKLVHSLKADEPIVIAFGRFTVTNDAQYAKALKEINEALGNVTADKAVFLIKHSRWIIFTASIYTFSNAEQSANANEYNEEH